MKFLKIYFFLVVLIVFKSDYAYGEDFKSYFPLQSGNSWEFTEVINDSPITEKIIFDDSNQPENSNERKIWRYQNCGIVVTEEGLKVCSLFIKDNLVYGVSPALLVFPFCENFPVKHMSCAVTNEGKNVATIIRELEYLGKEDVTVPAGHFDDCIKFFMSISLSEKENYFQRIYILQWVAKGVGVVQKMVKSISWNENRDVVIEIKKLELRRAIIDGMVWENDTQTCLY
ncbi:MAG: hypothetical protein KJ893_01340 [Candidatus Omnitrophica bacterium]|nr:hypothetical protein [Candidatus Omnitrophota bacterium]MBU4478006.1 hypothetical protein [Candidatus Omnitrophota bacterium]MCG2703939.1 hypothetical protein [Candidatus Omnitrophota bacterium]